MCVTISTVMHCDYKNNIIIKMKKNIKKYLKVAAM